MIVIIPEMILTEIQDHAHSHPDREVIGVLLGKTTSNGRIIEITDIVSYPEAAYPERAVLPGSFLYNRIGDEIRERNDTVNVKGYYHSHPPDVYPLKFSQIDFRQYEDLQNVFARKQPFLSIIVDPISREYVFLTLDVDRREIHLKPFTYENLVWVDYAVKRFSDGFSPYRIDPKTGEGIFHPKFHSYLDKISLKYKQKKIVKIMFCNALKYRENMKKHSDKIEDIEDMIEMFGEAENLYYNEDFVEADRLLEQFIKAYVDRVSERIEEIEERAAGLITENSPQVVKVNRKMHMLVKNMEKVFPHDAARIAGIILGIKRKIDDLGEPFCYIGIDKSMELTFPPRVSITEDHLKYVEDMVDEEIIEHLGQDALDNLEKHLESREQGARQVDFINYLLHSYFQHYYKNTKEKLQDEINEALIFKYIKKGYSLKGLFFEDLTLAVDNLKEIFGHSYQEALSDIEEFIKEKIQKDIGMENLQELLYTLRKDY